MNSFVVTRSKEIIIGLLVIILLLIILLFNACKNINSGTYSPETRIPQKNLINFVNLLFDPSQNVHGVMLLAPDRPNKLVILSKFLEPIDPCHQGGKDHPVKHEVRIENGKVEIPEECKKDIVDLRFSDKEDQLIAFTPATTTGRPSSDDPKTSEINKIGYSSATTDHLRKGVSLLYISDLDHNSSCTAEDGIPCPRHNHRLR
jgi:hypothetical protein